MMNLLERLQAWQARHPDQEAVVDYAGPDAAHPRLWRRSTLTVADVWQQVVRLAAALQRKGVRSGDVVAVQLPNWHEYLVAFLANHAIGAVTTSISPIFRGRDVARQLELSDAAVLIVPGAFGAFDYIGMARDLMRDSPSLRHVVVAGDADAEHEFYAWRDLLADGGSDDAAGLREQIIAGALAPDRTALAVLNFSSGTTGEPKGVMHSEASVSACIPPTIERLELDAEDVLLVVPTLGHGAGILNGLFLPLMLPAKVVYLDRWDAALAIEVIARERVTYMPAMPTYMFDLARLPDIPPDSVQSWVTARVSGGAIARDVMAAIHARFPRLRLCPGWGMSETLWATCGAPGDPLDKRNTTEGRPVGDWRIQIRDAGLEHEVPAGESGEIVVKGGSLMLGYWRREAMTKASFTPDGWFKTGDIGRLDAEGFLVLTGRSKELVIRGGENVPIVEIEALLMEHPHVRAAAVVGIPDSRLGEKVCAVVECFRGTALTLGEISDYLIGRRLTKQFIPQFLLVVDELPRTAVGKVKKQAVRDDAVRRLSQA